jgi:hypothetical protein
VLRTPLVAAVYARARASPPRTPRAQVSTDQMAVVDGLDTGLWFGPGDFKVLLKRGEPTRATCKVCDCARALVCV